MQKGKWGKIKGETSLHFYGYFYYTTFEEMGRILSLLGRDIGRDIHV
jgi:hypothetical protein